MITTVIFDFGQTLFDWAGADRTEGEIARGIATLLGCDDTEAARIGRLAAVMWPGITGRAGYPHGELDLVVAMTEVFTAAGRPQSAGQMRALIHAEHAAWPAQRHIPAEIYAMLDALAADGLRIAVCSNTIDPVENCRADLDAAGLTPRLAASLFSTEVGMRKPNPGIYAEMLRRLGDPDPREVLFVGDRMLEDVITPASLGMRSCLATYFRNENPHARVRAARPADIVALVRRINGPDRAIA